MKVFGLISGYIFINIIVLMMVFFWYSSVWLSRRAGDQESGIKLIIFHVIAFIPLTAIPIFGALLPDSKVKFYLTAFGNVWLGFMVYYFMIHTVVMLVCIFVMPFTKKRVWHIPKRAVWVVPVSVMAASLVINIYGYFHAKNTVVTYDEITVEKSAGDLEQLKIVLIADLHMSVNSHPALYERAVELVNNESPDLVLIAGDFFTSTYNGLENPEQYRQILSGLKAKYGVIAVMGNHDVVEPLFGGFPLTKKSDAYRPEEIESFVLGCGFTLLDDEVILTADGRVQVAGRLDRDKPGQGPLLRKTAQELLTDADPSLPLFVLEHEPAEFKQLAFCGADAVFCGHTHDGQLFPGNLIVPFFNENSHGLKVVDGMTTYVTAGLGFYGPPIRVGTNSEINVITVHFSKNAALP